MIKEFFHSLTGELFFTPFFYKKQYLILFFSALILCVAVIPLEIGSLKAVFFKSRPDQIFEFGGTMPHVNLFHFLWNEPDATNWPGGHASGGAALLSLYFPLRQRSAKWRCFAIALALFYWFVMSWTQVIRGQHFMSHNLWTLWFAWLTILLIHQKIFHSHLFPRKP